MTMQGDKLSYVPPRGGRPHLRSLLARVDRLTRRLVGSGACHLPVGATAPAPRRRDRASDFYDNEEETRREMRRVAQRGHDVAMLQLISPDERALPFSGHVEIEDLESHEHRLVDAAVGAATLRRSDDRVPRALPSARARDGIDYG